ncbi:hypothetical protein HDU86_005028 [Geranomyces michiganensis]|nr:hypothetical protein HDU86_005028 [Geranomyces michiganensis]
MRSVAVIRREDIPPERIIDLTDETVEGSIGSEAIINFFNFSDIDVSDPFVNLLIKISDPDQSAGADMKFNRISERFNNEFGTNILRWKSKFRPLAVWLMNRVQYGVTFDELATWFPKEGRHEVHLRPLFVELAKSEMTRVQLSIPESSGGSASEKQASRTPSGPSQLTPTKPRDRHTEQTVIPRHRLATPGSETRPNFSLPNPTIHVPKAGKSCLMSTVDSPRSPSASLIIPFLRICSSKGHRKRGTWAVKTGLPAQFLGPSDVYQDRN